MKESADRGALARRNPLVNGLYQNQTAVDWPTSIGCGFLLAAAFSLLIRSVLALSPQNSARTVITVPTENKTPNATRR